MILPVLQALPLPLQPLPFRHQGTAPVQVRVEVSPAESISVKNPNLTISPATRGIVVLTCTRPPENLGRYLLKVQSNDGAPRDAWDPQSRWQTRTILFTLKIRTPARLRIDEDVAIFQPGKVVARTVKVWNDGGELLTLAPLEPPPGFEISWENARSEPVSDPIVIPSGAYCNLKIRPSTSTSGTLNWEIYSHDLAQAHLLTLHTMAREQVRLQTDFVVGVDFGTSGTSIVVRPGGSDTAHFLEDSQGSKRFPTAIYVRLVEGRERGFFIGTEAIAEYDRTPKEGFFVPELKTELRRERDMLREKYGTRYGRDELLRRYLQELRVRYIDPATQSDQPVSIAWCFSVPVLDSARGGSGELFRRQRKRMEMAAVTAGFVGDEAPGCTLETFTEPFCAAVYLLNRHSGYRFPNSKPPQDGDWMCVFDSGGGTTDVVLGQVQYDGPVLRFEEVATLGGHTEEVADVGSLVSPEVATFGGKRLTESLALYLVLTKGNFLTFFMSPDGSLVPEEEEARVELIKRARQVHGGTYQEDESDRLEPWHAPVRRLLPKCDEVKTQVAVLDDDRTRVRLIPESEALDAQRLGVTRQEFDKLVDQPLELIEQEMNRSVFMMDMDPAQQVAGMPAPSDVRWVFPVGGNTRVRFIQEDFLPRYFGKKVEDLKDAQGNDELRMLAVAGGTVYASDSRLKNAMPYTIFVEDTEGNRGSFIMYVNDSLTKAPGPPMRFNIPLNAQQQLRMKVEIGGKQFIIGKFSVGNVDTTSDSRLVSVFFSVHGRTLTVDSDETGTRQLKWEYLI